MKDDKDKKNWVRLLRNVFGLGPVHRHLFAIRPEGVWGWVSRARDVAIYVAFILLGTWWMNPQVWDPVKIAFGKQ